MFNVAVLNLKDIIKYLVGMAILFFIIFFGAKYMKNIKKKSEEITSSADNISTEISEKNFLPCIETTLPVISQLESNKESNELNENKDILKEILKTQISSIGETEKLNEEVVEDEKKADEKIDEKIDEKENTEIAKEEKAVANQSRRSTK